MIVDLERRGITEVHGDTCPVVADERIRMIVSALRRFGIDSVHYSENASKSDPTLAVVSGLHAAAQVRQHEGDAPGLTMIAQTDYETALAETQHNQLKAAAVVPAELGKLVQRPQRMGQVSFIPFANRLDVLVLAPLHVILPRDFEPVSAELSNPNTPQ